MKNTNHVKLLFEHNNNMDDGSYGIESAWGVKAGDNYKLDNILFYAKEYSLGDIVEVETRGEEKYVIGLVKPSGHSTVRIIFNDQTQIANERIKLKSMGCESEISDVNVLVSVDIPSEVDYLKIREYLEKGENDGKWSFEEACIAHS